MCETRSQEVHGQPCVACRQRPVRWDKRLTGKILPEFLGERGATGHFRRASRTGPKSPQFPARCLHVIWTGGASAVSLCWSLQGISPTAQCPLPYLPLRCPNLQSRILKFEVRVTDFSPDILVPAPPKAQPVCPHPKKSWKLFIVAGMRAGRSGCLRGITVMDHEKSKLVLGNETSHLWGCLGHWDLQAAGGRVGRDWWLCGLGRILSVEHPWTPGCS